MAVKEMEEQIWGRRRTLMMWAAGLLRLLLVAYAEWHDAHMEVPYTDIDYYVFSDAAALVTQGKSPFDRSTYRYTPLLAFILLLNTWIHRCWGKLLFSAADLVVAHMICKVLKLRKLSERHCAICAAAWLFNPFTFAVGTRGNCEALVCAGILWLLICLMTGRLLQAAVWFGVVVHVRIYPIIYLLPILVLLDSDYGQIYKKNSHVGSQESTGLDTQSTSAQQRLWQFLRHIINWRRVVFGGVSGGVFLTLCGVFYYIYGMKYLQESLFYHLTRNDHRHNFSIYFYSIYLNEDLGFTVTERLLAFVPQMSVQLVLIYFFAKDLPFCLFLQTFAFVTFNKVMTAQYFVWYFCLLPLILPYTTLKLRWKGTVIMAIWTGAQLHWLGWAYLLEFKGKNVFLPLWIASLIFFAANIFVLFMVIAYQTCGPLFTQGRLVHLREKESRKEA
ncbi:unnamed protein product [Calypogeia fissa]